MVDDPLLKYAVEHEEVSQRLIEICEMPKTSLSSDEAHSCYMELKQAADNGSGLAMCLCALFCRIGLVDSISSAKAIEWGRKAASKLFAPGFFDIGYCYEHGIGAEIDFVEALNCYKESVSAGYGYAAAYLAAKYHDGGLGERDVEKAIYYAELGYEYGDSTAPLLLGGWFENGDGIRKSEGNAVTWYERASELGSFLATDRLQSAYEHGELGLVINKSKAKKYSDLFESQIP
ncbi:MAG: sel1 repeat family protein [Candidatus Thiodiazotropha taylori]|nr:sel1 repeat family protein [Candidatus Thiodiazotropha taylori]